MKYAIAGTVAYLIVVICAALMMGEPPTKANEWGDYAAGFVAPVALAWFIGTLILQRNELALQRQELELQREEMRLTRGVLKEQAEMQFKSNTIAASTLFAESVPRHERLLDQYVLKIAQNAPRELQKKGMAALVVATPVDVHSTITFFDNLNAYEIGKDDCDFSSPFLEALSKYDQAFLNFHKQAALAERAIDVEGPYLELWGRVDHFLGNNSDLEILGT